MALLLWHIMTCDMHMCVTASSAGIMTLGLRHDMVLTYAKVQHVSSTSSAGWRQRMSCLKH
jgi:hypothetical protein